MNKLIETTRESELIFKGRVFTVKRDKVALYNGNPAVREVVEHNGGVCIAAVDDAGNVCLVDQFRYACGQVLTEFPAGKLEPGEDPDEAAARELSEETGFTADRIEKLAVQYPTPGYCGERLHLYLATGLHAGEQHPDQDEYLNSYQKPLKEVVAMVERGEILDGKTQVLALLAAKKLGL